MQADGLTAGNCARLPLTQTTVPLRSAAQASLSRSVGRPTRDGLRRGPALT